MMNKNEKMMNAVAGIFIATMYVASCMFFFAVAYFLVHFIIKWW